MSGAPTLVVIAKEPLPGRSKTRLCPPLEPEQAAAVAEAALADTLAAVAAAPARRRVLALEGSPGDWLPPGFDVVPQPGGGLGGRLAAAFEAAGAPTLIVGMDTPQLTPALLERAAAVLSEDGVDAVLGPAADGGYWTVGLRRPVAGAFDGVPMSTPRTQAAQRARLAELGLAVRGLPLLRDVDTIDDAHAVATHSPRTRFAVALAAALATPSARERSPAPRRPILEPAPETGP